MDEAIAAYEAQAEEAAAAGNEPLRLNRGSYAQGLRTYRALARGDVELAVAEYEKPMPRAAGWMMGLLRYSIGVAYLEQGNAAEAVPYLRSMSTFFEAYVPSRYYLGEAYEALGDPEKARLEYASFLRWWEEADPELDLWKERAQRALERLARESRVE
jgi:predicted Zn-dependent protease